MEAGLDPRVQVPWAFGTWGSEREVAPWGRWGPQRSTRGACSPKGARPPTHGCPEERFLTPRGSEAEHPGACAGP